MLIVSMGASIDGFIADRSGRFDWSEPSQEQFAFHLAEVRRLSGVLCGRRLYESMVVWETDPAMREMPLGAEFADAWAAIPKIVFSRTLEQVEGNARLTSASLAEEAAAAVGSQAVHYEVGGAGLAAQAIEQGLVDELGIFRNPVIVGGGTPLLPAISETIELDLLETRTFAERVVFERYGRVR